MLQELVSVEALTREIGTPLAIASHRKAMGRQVGKAGPISSVDRAFLFRGLSITPAIDRGLRFALPLA